MAAGATRKILIDCEPLAGYRGTNEDQQGIPAMSTIALAARPTTEPNIKLNDLAIMCLIGVVGFALTGFPLVLGFGPQIASALASG